MKRIIACMVVLLSVLVAPAARGQTSPGSEPSWSPREVRPAESAGEVVLKFTTKDPGRYVYYTEDGDCGGYPSAEDPANPTPLSPAECGRPFARTSEDYGAVRGEWIFTEAGSRTIRIPIIDDDLDETDGEAFAVNASRHDDVAGTTVWWNAYIRIVDDDPRVDSNPSNHGDAPPPVVGTTVVSRAEQRPTGSLAVDTAAARTGSPTPPAPVPASGAPVRTTVASPPPDLEVALPSGELEPGPGFELVIERDQKPAPERDDPSGGSGAWWPLAFGATAVGSGGVVWLRRLRRWSPTRL